MRHFIHGQIKLVLCKTGLPEQYTYTRILVSNITFFTWKQVTGCHCDHVCGKDPLLVSSWGFYRGDCYIIKGCGGVLKSPGTAESGTLSALWESVRLAQREDINLKVSQTFMYGHKIVILIHESL